MKFIIIILIYHLLYTYIQKGKIILRLKHNKKTFLDENDIYIYTYIYILYP